MAGFHAPHGIASKVDQSVWKEAIDALLGRVSAGEFAEGFVTAAEKCGRACGGRRRDKIQWVHVRHEEVAAFAAGAEAHLTGEHAACAGSCGPGNLHLTNGLFDCRGSRVPVLAIPAQISSAEIGAPKCPGPAATLS